MTAISDPSRFVHQEERDGETEIRDEADARICLAAAKKSGLTRAAWCRASGVDGRSLRAWSMNLARRTTTGRRTKTGTSVAKRVELVELIAAPSAPARTTPRYTVRIGQLGIEVDDVQPTLLPSDPLASAIRYYNNHKAALLRFLDDPDIPIDNSPTEREFQNVAKLRLNAFFAGSSEGAHRACVLLGIAATCRALGVSAPRYMTWAVERLGTHRDVYDLALADVTPAAFAATNR